MRAIKTARIPVLKLQFIENMQVCYRFLLSQLDLLFAKLPEESFENFDLKKIDDIYVRGLDPKSVQSLNGWRDSQTILKFAGKKIELFSDALSFLKQWAKSKSILLQHFR